MCATQTDRLSHGCRARAIKPSIIVSDTDEDMREDASDFEASLSASESDAHSLDGAASDEDAAAPSPQTPSRGSKKPKAAAQVCEITSLLRERLAGVPQHDVYCQLTHNLRLLKTPLS